MIELTTKEQRLIRAVDGTPTLAYDLAQKAEVDNRAAGPVLSGLAKRQLIKRTYDEGQRAYRYSTL
jgi:hypothetical protein